MSGSVLRMDMITMSVRSFLVQATTEEETGIEITILEASN
jgi:hypothetical protein